MRPSTWTETCRERSSWPGTDCRPEQLVQLFVHADATSDEFKSRNSHRGCGRTTLTPALSTTYKPKTRLDPASRHIHRTRLLPLKSKHLHREEIQPSVALDNIAGEPRREMLRATRHKPAPDYIMLRLPLSKSLQPESGRGCITIPYPISMSNLTANQ